MTIPSNPALLPADYQAVLDSIPGGPTVQDNYGDMPASFYWLCEHWIAIKSALQLAATPAVASVELDDDYPETIWLTRESFEGQPLGFQDGEEIGWSVKKTYPNDVEYIKKPDFSDYPANLKNPKDFVEEILKEPLTPYGMNVMAIALDLWVKKMIAKALRTQPAITDAQIERAAMAFYGGGDYLWKKESPTQQKNFIAQARAALEAAWGLK